MRQIVYDQPARLIAWAEQQIPHCRFRPDAKAIGLVCDEKVRAAAVYDTFTTTSCFMHLASDGSKTWASREFLIRIFAYPFIQLGYGRVSGAVSELNAASMNIVERFGGVLEGIQRRAGPMGEDLLLFGMLRQECRVLHHIQSGVSGEKPL